MIKTNIFVKSFEKQLNFLINLKKENDKTTIAKQKLITIGMLILLEETEQISQDRATEYRNFITEL